MDIQLEKILYDLGYSKAGIARVLDVKEPTLDRWLNLQGVDQAVKFIELLLKLDICPRQFLNTYNQNPKKYRCPEER